MIIRNFADCYHLKAENAMTVENTKIVACEIDSNEDDTQIIFDGRFAGFEFYIAAFADVSRLENPEYLVKIIANVDVIQNDNGQAVKSLEIEYFAEADLNSPEISHEHFDINGATVNTLEGLSGYDLNRIPYITATGQAAEARILSGVESCSDFFYPIFLGMQSAAALLVTAMYRTGGTLVSR